MRSWITLGSLLAVVVALGFWVSQKPKAPDREAHALSSLTAADVKRIRLAHSGPSQAQRSDGQSPAQNASASGSTVELERGSEGWRMTAPFAARADALQVERLLAILDARSLARYPAQDLGRYGLDAPIATLSLNDETFSFGAVNTMTREQYVLGRDGVYAIPLSQRTALPRDATSVISKALFAPGETPIRFELETFTATLEDGRWTFAPAADDPGPDERNGWIAAWRQASAIRATPHDGRKPLGTITVTLQGGRTISLGILQREPELVLLRSDEGIQYQFVADTGKRLLSLPGPAREQGTK
jgi:hypothetical protein